MKNLPITMNINIHKYKILKFQQNQLKVKISLVKKNPLNNSTDLPVLFYKMIYCLFAQFSILRSKTSKGRQPWFKISS